MIIVTALRTHAAATKTEELVAGRVGMEAAFHFSPEWDGLGKTAVFEAGGVAKDVIIGDDPCIVPHECMIEGAELRVGIYGMSTDGTIVIPTVYALVGTVKKGADPSGDESYPPTPDVGEQAIALAGQAREDANAAKESAQAAQEAANEVVRRADSGEFDGGYYTPGVSQPAEDIVRMSFTPSTEGMPSAESVDIKLPVSDSIPGGYYVPSVEQVDKNTMKVSFSASEETMEAVQEVNVTLPAGRDGDPGKSAYEYAREGGFVGTEEDFAELLAGNSVKTFGAVGDGVTDDTAAFQAALAAERVVCVYGGTYLLSGKLLIRENCCLTLSQDTVLRWADEYTSDNCIEMQRLANIRGNHATIFVPYTFGAHVIHASTDVEDGNANDVPPWTAWNPQWKMSRYVTDINICKPNSWGGRCNSLEGDVYGTAVDIYCERNTAADYGTGLEQSFMWGVNMSGVRIAGGFEYGIRIHNDGTAWNHDMRIEAVVESCETGVSIENCHMVHLAAAIQPSVAQKPVDDAVVETKYAKYGIKLVDSHNVDLSQSYVWDWQHARTDSEEYTHIAMYGNCYGVVLNEPRYYESGVDVRESIYTDTPSNLEKMTILQEPITRWFKPKGGVPYFSDGQTEKPLMLRSELQEYFVTDRVKGFTDVLAIATDTDGTVYNGVGYKKGSRIVMSSGEVVSDSNSAHYVATGFIPVKAGDVVHISGASFDTGDGWTGLCYYDASFNRIWQATCQVFMPGYSSSSTYFQEGVRTEDGVKITLKTSLSERGAVAYIRVTFHVYDFGDYPVISVNEEIKFEQHGFLADNIKVKGANVIGGTSGGGGSGIDVTAAVGQTIVVKAADENGKPTEWESADYQPRTHYTEVIEKAVLFDGTWDFSEANPWDFPRQDGRRDNFDLGKQYRVILDGHNYTLYPHKDAYGNHSLGADFQENGIFLDFSVYPFYFTCYGDKIKLNCKTLEVHTIRVSEVETVVHKIDPKYLPEGVGYSEVIEILPETTVEIDPEAGMGRISAEFTVESGKEYAVKYNGAEYLATCYDLGGVFALGNVGALQEGLPVTGEPFLVVYTDVSEDGNVEPIYGWAVAPLDGAASVTLSIEQRTLKKIEDKYLPDAAITFRLDVYPDGNSYKTSTTAEELLAAYKAGRDITAYVYTGTETVRKLLRLESMNTDGAYMLTAVFGSFDIFEGNPRKSMDREFLTISWQFGDAELTCDHFIEPVKFSVQEWATNAVPAAVGQYFRVSAVDENGNVTAVEAVDAPSGGGESAEVWELLADVTLEEEVQTVDVGLFASPQKKIRVILDTLAAETDTNYMPTTIKTANNHYSKIIKFYPLAMPRKNATRSVYQVEALGGGKAMVAWSSNTSAVAAKGTIFRLADSVTSNGDMIVEPIDNYGDAINDELTGFSVQSYGTFAIGTRLRVWGVAK